MSKQRELKLHITDSKGRAFNEEVLEEIEEERRIIENLKSGENLPKDISFRIQKRGIKYDHLGMSIDLLEAPAGDKQGVKRREGREVESLLDKLYEVMDAWEEGKGRPASILIDESEWKVLRDRVEEHSFPKHNRATRFYQRAVITDCERVAVEKAEEEPEVETETET